MSFDLGHTGSDHAMRRKTETNEGAAMNEKRNTVSHWLYIKPAPIIIAHRL